MSIICGGGGQVEQGSGGKEADFAKGGTFARRAVSDGVQILAFPECCITGYWYLRKLTREGLSAIAEAVPEGESTRRLAGLARETGMTIGAGLVEAEGERFYNTYVVAMPD